MFALQNKIDDTAKTLADCFDGNVLTDKRERLTFAREILETIIRNIAVKGNRSALVELIEMEERQEHIQQEPSFQKHWDMEHTILLILLEWLTRNIPLLETRNKQYTVTEALCLLRDIGYIEKMQNISNVCSAIAHISNGEYLWFTGSTSLTVSRWLWDNVSLKEVCLLLEVKQANKILTIADALGHAENLNEYIVAAVNAVSIIEIIETKNVSLILDLGQLMAMYALNEPIQKIAADYFNKTYAEMCRKGRKAGKEPYISMAMPQPRGRAEDAYLNWKKLPDKDDYADGIKDILFENGLREDYEALKKGVPLGDIIAGL